MPLGVRAGEPVKREGRDVRLPAAGDEGRPAHDHRPGDRDGARQHDPRSRQGVARAGLPGRDRDHARALRPLVRSRARAGARPFFAQREAIETIAFLTEAPADRRVGIDIPKTEEYERWAIKLATGAGKTLVMAMVIAWSGLNKAANKQDTRFADAFLVVCPNLTVKERLSGPTGSTRSTRRACTRASTSSRATSPASSARCA